MMIDENKDQFDYWIIVEEKNIDLILNENK
jgi:hypothetical protein